MAGKVKQLQISEGTTVSAPNDLAIPLANFASDAAFVASKGSAAAEGDQYYNSATDTARLYAADAWDDMGSGGGGAGGINYLEADNTDFEKGTIGDWLAYDDASTLEPVDGVGTADQCSIDTSGAVLRGSYCMEIIPGTGAQGEGAAVDFTIDPADKAKMLTVSFDYSAGSAFTYGTNGDATDPSDITVWIYDDDANTLIQLAPYTLDGSGTFSGVFQTHATSTNYRLILHVSGTTTGWGFYVDNVVVGPQTKVKGNNLWPSYDETEVSLTEVVTSLGSLSHTGTFRPYQNSGGEWRLLLNLRLTSGSGTELAFDIDGIELPTYRQAMNLVGSNLTYTANAYAYEEALAQDFYLIQSTSNGFWYLSGDIALASKPTWATKAAPILSSGADTRVVAAHISGGDTSLASTSYTVYKYDDISKDTHNAYDASTGKYTAPVAGWYSMSAQIGGTYTNVNTYLRLAVNGSNYIARKRFGDGFNARVLDVSIQAYYLNAGDYVQVEYYQTTGNPLTVPDDAWDCFFSIHRLSGPAQIQASEVVAARYTFDNADSFTTNSWKRVCFDTKDFDTHNSVSAGTFAGNDWEWSAPVSGFYTITAAFSFATTAGTDWAAGSEVWPIEIYKGGVSVSAINFCPANGAENISNMITGMLYFNTGDTFYIYSKQKSNSTLTTITTATRNYIEIHRLGGIG